MRHTLARALSIVGHPLCIVPLASALAIASHGLGWRALGVTAIFFVSLSLIVFAFAWRQVRAGRWQDIDASNVAERRSLNYFLAAVLFIGAFLSFRQSQPLGLTLGLSMSGGLVVLTMLLSRWVKVSLHVAYLVYSTAILWYSDVWLVAAGLCLAAAVAWSRLELRRHALVEVVLGGIIGGIAGLVFWVLLLRLLR